MTETLKIGNVTLYCGDCRDIIDSLTFDSIVTDPPYGMGKYTHHAWEDRYKSKNLHSGGTWSTKDIYQNIDWDDETPDLSFLLQRNVPTMIFGGNYFADLPPSRKWIVWDKGETHYRRSFAEGELCWCSFDGNLRIVKYIPDFNKGFVSNGSRAQKVHPTQKPVAVMRYCISELPKDSGNIVLDPYMGSGTTGVAAVKMGRAFIGIEKNRQYFDSACERIEKAQTDYSNQFSAVRHFIEQNRLTPADLFDNDDGVPY